MQERINAAKNNLEKFQFEQTEIGSFVFSVGVQVADEDYEQMYLEEAAPPRMSQMDIR